MRPTSQQISEIRSNAAEEGLYLTPSQAEAYFYNTQKNQNNLGLPRLMDNPINAIQDTTTTNQNVGNTNSLGVTETDFGTIGTGFQGYKSKASTGEQIGDFATAATYNALDSITFGLTGLLYKNYAPESYASFQEELYDTAGGRMGAAAGGLAGFLVPYGAVGRATSVLTKGIQGARQTGMLSSVAKATSTADKLKAIDKIARPTTKTLQTKAALNLVKKSEDIAKRSTSPYNPLTQKEALKIVKRTSDDIVGFKAKGKFNKFLQPMSRPAYQMENSADFVNSVRTTLKNTMPDRLAVELSKKGLNFKSNRELLKLSDTMADAMAAKPYNQIETILGSMYGGDSGLIKGATTVLGWMGQEAINLGITGTIFDYVGSIKGEIDLEEQSLLERSLHHALLGGGFGFVRAIPGGRGRPIWKDIVAASGRSTKKLNKSIAKMESDQLKGYMRATLKTDRSATFNIKRIRKNGDEYFQRIRAKDLKPGNNTIKKEDIPGLKQEAIRQNNKRLGEFRKGLPKEVGQDFKNSFVRASIGGVLFNAESMLRGDLNQMGDSEIAFHFGLGFIMSKAYRPVIPGGKPATGALHFGERPYYYNTELGEIMRGMDQANIYRAHMSDIVKQFDGGLHEDVLVKTPNQDIDNIKDILIRNNVIYDGSSVSIKQHELPGNNGAINRELDYMLGDIYAKFSYEGFESNPNATKSELDKALREIKSLESISLSTTETPVLFTNKSNINRANILGAAESINNIKADLFNLTTNSIQILTGDPNFVRENGKIKRFEYDSDGGSLNSAETEALATIEFLRDEFIDRGLLSYDANSLDGQGVRITDETLRDKAQEIQRIKDDLEFKLGNEYQGNTDIPFDLKDGQIWKLLDNLDYEKNITGVLDVIQEKVSPTSNKTNAREIQDLLYEIFGSPLLNSDKSLITRNPKNIKLNIENIDTFDLATVEKLDHFVRDMWGLQSSLGKRPKGPDKSYEVSIDRVQRLVDLLSDEGMPNYVDRYFDSRLMQWIEKANVDAISRTLEGLEQSPIEATVLKNFMMHGLLQTGGKDGATILEMQRTITAEDFMRFKDMTKGEADKYVEAYERVKLNLEDIKRSDGARVLDFPSERQNIELTEDMLSVIMAADRAFNSNSTAKELELINEKNAIYIFESEQRIKSLKAEMEVIPEGGQEAYNVLKGQMELELVKSDILVNEQVEFIRSWGGGIELTRASAQLHQMQNLKNPDNLSYNELLNRVQSYDLTQNGARKELETWKDNLSDIRQDIASIINKDPSVMTLNSVTQGQRVRAQKELEIEGRTPESNNYINPQKFVQKYNVDVSAIVGDGINYGDPSKYLDILYSNTIVSKAGTPERIKEVNKYIEKMFNVAGFTSDNAPDLLRDEVLRLASLAERSIRVKQVSINASSGTGSFEFQSISKGFLTDTWLDMTNGQHDLIMISDKYIDGGQVKRISTEGDGKLADILSSPDFFAGRVDGNETAKSMHNSTITSVDPNKQNLPGGIGGVNDYTIKGRQTIIPIDENITILFPEKAFHDVAENFLKWFEKTSKSDYVINARKQFEGANNLYIKLEEFANNLNNSKMKKSYDINGLTTQRNEFDLQKFIVDDLNSTNGKKKTQEYLFTMVNSMYGSKANENWLYDAYNVKELGLDLSKKDFKYRRLAQNLGYKRNSDDLRTIVSEMYKNSNNKYFRDISKRFNVENHEFDYTLTIDDGTTSKAGETPTDLITDVRSNALFNLEKQKSNISAEEYANMKEILENSNSLNAEEVNASTLVRRDRLDYALLMDGKSDVIGQSSGQKPVGLSSFTDSNGMINVFYNKTHYFYHSKFDNFFKQNPDIVQIAFKSGAKKSAIVDPKTLINTFKPYGGKNSSYTIPKTKDNVNLESWINSLKGIDKKHEAVFPQKFNQSLAGTSYGKAKDAKYSKQLENWTPGEIGELLYEQTRSDAVEQFALQSVELFNPENTAQAAAEARGMIMSESNPDGYIKGSTENVNIAHLMIEAGGVPFNSLTRNAYEGYIKKKYIDNAGVFDGYTNAGGSPILRGNFENNLNIPIYAKNANNDQIQTRLGEFNTTPEYLRNNIIFRDAFGAIKAGIKTSRITKKNHKQTASITLAVDLDGRDILVDLKTKQIYDPNETLANKKSFKNLKDLPKDTFLKIQFLVDNLTGKGTVSAESWLDIQNTLATDFKYDNIYMVGAVVPNPRTGPHDVVISKLSKKGLLNDKDGGILELNNYDVTMRAQRDFDTDKVVFMLDNNFEFMKYNMANNGDVLEPNAPDPNTLEGLQFDMYEYSSYNTHLKSIKNRSRVRGPVQKMHRSVTYLNRLFEKVGNIKLGDEFISFKIEKDFKQRMVSDSQNILDIYGDFSSLLTSANSWKNKTLYGNSTKRNTDNVIVDADKPLLYLVDSKGNKRDMANDPSRFIVDKLVSDYSNLLNLEGNLWEFGETKTPRYKDMVRNYSEFKKSYHKNKVNWEYYYYVKAKAGDDVALKLFFDGDAKKLKEKNISPVMNAVAEAIMPNDPKVNPHITNFLRSLDGIAKKDYMQTAELFNTDGESFSQAIMDYVGRDRQESLQILQFEGIRRSATQEDFEARNTYTQNIWEAFNARKDWQKTMIQANAIEQNLIRKEKTLSKMRRDRFADPVAIELKQQELLIERVLLNDVMSKLSFETGKSSEAMKRWGTKLIRGNKGGFVKAPKYGEYAIVNETSGLETRTLKSGDKDYKLKTGEVAVQNPVKLKPASKHDIIDGVSWFYTLGGQTNTIKEIDLPLAQRLFRSTHKKINEALSEIISSKKVRDWTDYQEKVDAAVDDALVEFLLPVIERGETVTDLTETSLGNIPVTEQNYPIDFLAGLMLSRPKANPNEFYMLPKSQSLVPAVNKPNQYVIKAAFRAMEKYNLHPDLPDYVSEIARTHAAFYDALVGGRGFYEALSNLEASTFEGALLKKTLDNALHSPYVSSKEFKTLSKELDLMPPVESQFGEYFRQILQDGAIVDPYTAMKIKRNIVNDPNLGMEAYKNIFVKARGQVLFDGVSSKVFGLNEGTGIKISDIVSDVRQRRSEQLIGKKKYKNEDSVIDFVESVVSRDNEAQTQKELKENCD